MHYMKFNIHFLFLVDALGLKFNTNITILYSQYVYLRGS